jgi:branched-chain amino acid transport system ATP-binding protein
MSTHSSGTPVLEVHDVKVHFGGVKAVDGISLTLERGTIYGIIGPNGSGKSTLVGALTRLTRLSAGRLSFEGADYHRSSPARVARMGIARTFQTVRLLRDLTVRENVRLGADRSTRGTQSRLAQQRADEALERVGLSDQARRYPDELSYGTQRRVEIARALAGQPRLLLLDEPTAGMNQAERAEISALMIDLRGDGLCQLLVEHDVQMMLDTCDHVFAMSSGRLITQGTPHEVVQHEEVRVAYLGTRWSAHA